MPAILVYYSQGPNDRILGTLFAERSRGREIYSFEFAPEAIRLGYANVLSDPELSPVLGRQYKSDPSEPFHFMSDASPDRWGRRLLKRAANGKMLSESDFLLGVSDASRMGALRFKTEPNGPFLSEGDEVPPYRFLRELEQAAFDFDEYSIDPRWRALLAPGSSLGGARPKASIHGPDGSLYLAKFSSQNDREDLPQLEYLTYLLAVESGIEMMPSTWIPYQIGRSVFLTKRFDRDEQGGRVHYASFMTLLGAQDGDSGSYTYLDLAQILSTQSIRPKQDLRQLFRRIAFSLLLHNYDDHLRNHAMIRTNEGWALSPAFDLNISLDRGGLTIPVAAEGSTLGILCGSAPLFALEKDEAKRIVEAMRETLQKALPRLGKKASAPTRLLDAVAKLLG